MDKLTEQMATVRRAIERTYEPGRDYGAVCCDAINETKKLLNLLEAPQAQQPAAAVPVGHVRGVAMRGGHEVACIEWTGESLPYGTALFAAQQPAAAVPVDWIELAESVRELSHAGYCRVWKYGADQDRCECGLVAVRARAALLRLAAAERKGGES